MDDDRSNLSELDEGAIGPHGCGFRVLDLFAGCGGLSLGFQRAGFTIDAAVEIDPNAAASHGLNFHGGAAAHSRAVDITATDAGGLLASLSLKRDPYGAFDLIVGGPPCQAFARVGRAKLREVAAHPEAFLQDPRSNLYLRYLAFVEDVRPLAILMENVPDVLNYGGHNIALEMCDALAEMGYDARYTLLNAAHYGVPQMRERMFLLAFREDLSVTPVFPAPTHFLDLPRGYAGTRQVALKHLRDDDPYFSETPGGPSDLPAAVSAREALDDLPPITDHLSGRRQPRSQRLDVEMAYRASIPSAYARDLRAWPGFESMSVRSHVTRQLPRDYPIFAAMAPGDQYPEAHAVAEALFQRALKDVAAASGREPEPGSRSWADLRRSIVPPYDPTKFPNKWRKMEPDAPARTLMAHIGKDTYSHIHYDSMQARTISVREAARLQSFPDGFAFSGRMNASLRQIGNAVPPLLAYALATQCRASLGSALFARRGVMVNA